MTATAWRPTLQCSTLLHLAVAVMMTCRAAAKQCGAGTNRLQCGFLALHCSTKAALAYAGLCMYSSAF
jgi:hypothetical protein